MKRRLPMTWRTIRIAIALLGVVLPSAHAAVITASTCGSAQVQASINAALDGDTVQIPAGTCTWTTSVGITDKILTIQGAGIGRTVIIDGVSKANYPNIPQMLVYKTKNGGLSRITGMTFEGGSISDPYNKGMVDISGSSHQFRMDHVRFYPTQTAGLIVSGNVRGVIDHCIFDTVGWHFAIYTYHGSWNNTGSYGDTSWATPAPLGTAEAIFIEDNTFTSATRSIAHDGWSGGRVVFRYNTLINTAFTNHGTETSGRWRSQRSFEVYNNTITFNNSKATWASMVGIRGGTGVIFNNTGTTTNGGSTNVLSDLQYYRRSDMSRTYTPWGWCTGSNVWDGNTDQYGYPCIDQPGRGQGDLLSNFEPTPVGWPHQAREPIYAWNNKLNGSNSPTRSNVSTIIVENRDFYNTVKPGYTPYTYPHPLVSGEPSLLRLSAPTGLRVVQ